MNSFELIGDLNTFTQRITLFGWTILFDFLNVDKYLNSYQAKYNNLISLDIASKSICLVAPPLFNSGSQLVMKGNKYICPSFQQVLQLLVKEENTVNFRF